MEAQDSNSNHHYINPPMLLPRLFTEMKKLFRIAEIVLFLVFLTWAATRLPFAVRISGEYLRLLLTVVASHLFIFLLGNLIVLTLFFKSGAHLILFPQHNENSGEPHFDFCQDFIAGRSSKPTEESITPPTAAEEIVYQDKETIFEVTKRMPAVGLKAHRRSRSENLMKSSSLEEQEVAGGVHECRNYVHKQLRRSETDRPRRIEAENAEEVDEMSNEEFRRAIDDFIARQIKFHQEEKLAVVVSGHV